MEYDPAVAHVYVEALLEAAREAGVTDAVFEQADAVYRCFCEDTRLRRFLQSPQILTEEKHAVLDRIFKGRVEPLLLNLFHVMLRNNRIENLDDTLRLVYQLVEEQRGIIPATVTTAVPMKDDQRRDLEQSMQQRLGLKFDVKYREDPEVLGGVIFKYRDRQIDGSLRFDLQKIRERLRAVAID
jgi:F-type H+-transporting ATPase subunit delta